MNSNLFLQTILQKLQTIPAKKIYIGVAFCLILFTCVYSFLILLDISRKKEVWDLSPDNVIMALEIQQLFDNYELLKKQAFWEEIENIDYLYILSERLDKLQSIVKKDKQLEQFFKQNTCTITLHSISKDSFGALFFIPLASENESGMLKNMIAQFQKDKNFKFESRIFKNFQITEVRHQGFEDVFSFLIYEGFLIAGYSPVLIEDVIRKVDAGKSTFYFTKQSHLKEQLNSLRTSKVSLYLNPAKLPEFLGIHSEGKLLPFLKPIAQSAEFSFLNLLPGKNILSLAGYSFTQPEEAGELLNVFKGQAAKPFTLKNFIPFNTGLLFHFTFSNKEKFFEDLQRYNQNANKDFFDRQSDFQSRYQFDTPHFYSFLEGEAAFLILNNDSITNGGVSKLLIAKTASTPEAAKYLKELAKKSEEIAGKGFEKPYSKVFQGITIERIYVEELPSMLFTDLFSGFPSCYYAIIGNCIAFGNSKEEVEAWINAVKTGNVWSKTISNKQLNDQMTKSANLSILVNTSQLWSFLYQTASGIWKDRMNIYAPELQHIEFLSLQIQQQKEDRLASNFSFIFSEKNSKQNGSQNYTSLKEIALPNMIYSKPYLVRNHSDNSLEIFLQDNLNFLYLVNEQGMLLMKANAGGILQGEPIQVDFYKNNRLQYAFITRDRLQLIDRTGKPVNGFPIFLPEEELPHTFNVFDFDNDKKYHFIISSSDGTLYMYDENRRFAPGWNLKRFDARLSTPPQTFKFQGKDYILVNLENGRLFLYDKEGNTQKGFPIQLKGKIMSPFWIKEVEEALQPTFIGLSSRNQLVEIGFNGEILKISPLKRTQPQNTFEMIYANTMQEWLVAEQGGNTLIILDDSGKKIFEKIYDMSGKLKIQYFVFKSDLKIIAVTHETEKLTYLYDLQGGLLATLKSNKAIGMRYADKEGKIIVYKIDGRLLSTAFINVKK